MKVLVTGATGFVGSNLVSALVRRGHTVRVLVRNPARLSRLGAAPFEAVAGDIADRTAVMRAVQGQDIVFHNAGMVVEWGPRDEFYRVNVHGTRHLLDASCGTGIKRFVHTSSVTVLGVPRDANPIDERAPYTTAYHEHYTETKIISEELVLEYGKTRGLPVTVIRPGLVWGPGDTTLLPRLENLMRRKIICNIGKGNNRLILTYIDNLIEGLLLAAESPVAQGQVYHILDSEDITSRMFFSELTKAMGIQPPTFGVPYCMLHAVAMLCEAAAHLLNLSEPPLLSRYGLNLLACNGNYGITKARRELGYAAAVRFREGMEKMARWYAEERVHGSGLKV